MEEQNKETIVVQDESVKLSKNSKGYNWDIRLVAKEGQVDQNFLSRLSGINQIMLEEYGGGE